MVNRPKKVDAWSLAKDGPLECMVSGAVVGAWSVAAQLRLGLASG